MCSVDVAQASNHPNETGMEQLIFCLMLVRVLKACLVKTLGLIAIAYSVYTVLKVVFSRMDTQERRITEVLASSECLLVGMHQ